MPNILPGPWHLEYDGERDSYMVYDAPPNEDGEVFRQPATQNRAVGADWWRWPSVILQRSEGQLRQLRGRHTLGCGSTGVAGRLPVALVRGH